MCKKEGPTNEERAALLAAFPEPDYRAKESAARCWDMNPQAKLWEHHSGDTQHYEISGYLKVVLTRDQALAIARGLKPEPPRDLKLAQRQVARIVERQMIANGVDFRHDDILMDIAAQVVQALDVLGREVNDE